MANTAHNAPIRVRCLSCGHIDPPTRISRGPGWLAATLWALAGVFWLLGIWWWGFAWASWAALLAALLYTIWYFARRERVCRQCGARDLEPYAGEPG